MEVGGGGGGGGMQTCSVYEIAKLEIWVWDIIVSVAKCQRCHIAKHKQHKPQ